MKIHSIQFGFFLLYTPEIIPYAVLLSVCNSVGVCLWYMYSKVSRIDTAWCIFIFINRSATSDLAAEDITFLMILASTYIGPLKRLTFLLP